MIGTTTAEARQFRFPLMSAKGLVLRAALLAAVFLAMHLLGWRSHCAILCGTLGSDQNGSEWIGALGLLYVLFYLAAVVVAPILVLAGALMWGHARWRAACHAKSQDCHNADATITHE